MPKKSKPRGSTKEYEFVDAKKPLTIHIDWLDIKKAVPGNGRKCVISNAARREHKCFDVVLYRNVAYVRKTERSIPLRYQITEAVRDLLVAFDASGRAYPVAVTLLPPRSAISLKRLRSPERKARMSKARNDRKTKFKQKIKLEGGARRRRMYTKPDPLTLFGVRNGQGQRPFAKVR